MEIYLNFILTISCTMKEYFKINCWKRILHGSPTFPHVLQTEAVFAQDYFFSDALHNKHYWKIEVESLSGGKERFAYSLR